jgi:hypothetical protein
MKKAKNRPAAVHQFIVLPYTGIQICRGFTVVLNNGAPEARQQYIQELWRLAARFTRQQQRNEVLQLIRDHIACSQEMDEADRTDWIACDPNDFVYFRLTRGGTEVALDLVVDTHNGAGAQRHNKIPIELRDSGRWSRPKPYHLADVYVAEHREARNEIGSLIMDFGNSGSAFVFSRHSAGPLQAHIVEPANPFDPRYRERPAGERNILRSSMIVLRVGRNELESPWIILGRRAEELIRENPLATHLYAPKKYIRYWPPHLQAAEPTLQFRGVVGQRDGLYTVLELVEHALEQMLQQVLASVTNPHGTSHTPEFYPRITRLMATYPLTWRADDRRVFQTLLERVANRLFGVEEQAQSRFRAELVCSEPMAVAAYVLWETFFHFGTQNLPLAASFLGNMRGTPELRMLVVDIGGGSTDIAYVDIQWRLSTDDESVDVGFKMLESMRFTRAGDRLSHIIATAIREFIRHKYGLDESLDFKTEASHPALTRAYKRLVVSKLSELAEAAKIALASPAGQWRLGGDAEYDLMRGFEPLVQDLALDGMVQQGPHLVLDRAVLQAWVEADRQSAETHSEPGFMDIFFYLEELMQHLRADHREPHLVILSGRSTRLPFIKEMIVKALRLPPHRIRTLGQLPPASLRTQGAENLDKLAVVHGAQRFRFGDHIRFEVLPDEPVFNRHIGTVRETHAGLRLNKIFLQPGDSRPRTLTVTVEPGRDMRIGHAFRKDGMAEVIATLSNNSQTEPQRVELEVLDDFSLRLQEPHEAVFLAEWVPGGSDLIVDNFNDTGRIDGEPAGLLKRIVLMNKNRWLEQ